jgi:methionyl-tRNA formyltransferase
MRIVFMGSPAFGVPALRWLASQYEVVGIVTQPDRPAGRGRQILPPPVKTVALELGLPIQQPIRLRETAAFDRLRTGNRIRLWSLHSARSQPGRPATSGPRMRKFHASLLPSHRGAAPIPAASLAGDSRTGITLMRMDEGVDTGPILAQESLAVAADEDRVDSDRQIGRTGRRDDAQAPARVPARRTP